jgi:hypothetical protein
VDHEGRALLRITLHSSSIIYLLMVDTLMTKTKQESNHKCSNGQFTCYESYGYLYLEDDCPGGNSSEVSFCPFCGLDYNKLKAKRDKD